MAWLSPELARKLRHACLAVAWAWSRPAFAQVPVYRDFPAQPEPPPPSTAASPEPAPPAATSAEPQPPPAAEPLPAPPPEPGPAAIPATRKPPARTEVISEQRPRVVRDEDDDDSDEPGPALGSRRHWYGWQTLTVDGASFGLLLLAGAQGGKASSELTTGALIGYGFGAGIVHFAHGNPGRGFASFGVRLGMPLAGAIVGAGLDSGCNKYLCEASGAAIGLLLGMGGAIAIDAAVFAYDDPVPHADPHRLSLVPIVQLGRERALLGVSGQL